MLAGSTITLSDSCLSNCKPPAEQLSQVMCLQEVTAGAWAMASVCQSERVYDWGGPIVWLWNWNHAVLRYAQPGTDRASTGLPAHEMLFISACLLLSFLCSKATTVRYWASPDALLGAKQGSLDISTRQGTHTWEKHSLKPAIVPSSTASICQQYTCM